MHLAMRWLHLQPGDEVICSSLTFSASVNPVLYERATPVFVDSDTCSWNMDPALLAEAVEGRVKQGRRPKAVILVHIYGQSADIDPIARICQKYDIPLVEDAAEALGAEYFGNSEQQGGKSEPDGKARRPMHEELFVGKGEPGTLGITPNAGPIMRKGIAPGTIGLCGIFSFNGNKIITTSGGGMLVSNNQELIDKARFWATQARDPAPHYQHTEIGYNYRLSNVLAAIGRGQLHVLPQRIEARRAVCAYYQSALSDLPGIEFMPEPSWGRSTRWLTCVLIDPKHFGASRDAVRLALAAENIEARPVWKPMHLQPIFAGCDCFGGRVAEDLFARGLCLPSGSNLSTNELDRIVDAIRRVNAVC